MPVDESLLHEHASYRDATHGISERFIAPVLRSGATIGVLSEPLRDPSDLGWVLCHSFGQEHADLLSIEALIARQVAAAGFPVLRFHCQGYGESEHLEVEPSLRSHLEDTEDVIRQLPEIAGVERVGLIGLRFGSAVAALVAADANVHDVVLVDPVIDGRRYMDGFLRTLAMAYVVRAHSGSGPVPGVDDIRERLHREGVVDYRGYPLTPAMFDANGELDLIRDLRSFSGRALLVQVSAGDRLQRPVERLAGRMRELGGHVETRTAVTTYAGLFGQKHVIADTPTTNTDALAGFGVQLAELVADWVSGRRPPEGRGDTQG